MTRTELGLLTETDRRLINASS